MSQKTKLFFVATLVLSVYFGMTAATRAAGCLTGTCKAACSSTEEISSQAGDSCSDGEVCCVAKTTSGSSCADLVNGASCTTSSGQSGTCQGGSCSAATTNSGVTDYCVNLSDGATCLTFSGASGTCKSGTCVASSNGGGSTTTTTSGSGWNSSELTMFGLPTAAGTGDVTYVIIAVLDWLLTIVGIVAIIALVISGVQYFMVASDEKMAERAKKTMTSAIIGLVVALSGAILIFAVNSMLNAGILF